MLSNKVKSFRVVVILVLAIFFLYGSVVFGAEPIELLVGIAHWSQRFPAISADIVLLNARIEEINEQGKYKIELVATDAASKREKLRSDIEDLLMQDVDILLVSGQDAHDYAGWKELVERKREETGKPLVYGSSGKIPWGGDMDIESMGVDFAISTSDFNCGKVIAQHLIGYLFCKKGKYEGNIVEIRGFPGSASDTLRHLGFRFVLDEYTEIVTVFEQTDHYSRMEAYELVKTVLQKFEPGSIDAVFGYADEAAMGTLQAVKEAGREGEFLIYGVNAQSDAVRAVQEGGITATAAFRQVGTESLEIAIDILEGKSFEPFILMPDIFITIGNVNYVLAEGYKPFIVGEDVDWDQVNK